MVLDFKKEVGSVRLDKLAIADGNLEELEFSSSRISSYFSVVFILDRICCV